MSRWNILLLLNAIVLTAVATSSMTRAQRVPPATPADQSFDRLFVPCPGKVLVEDRSKQGAAASTLKEGLYRMNTADGSVEAYVVTIQQGHAVGQWRPLAEHLMR